MGMGRNGNRLHENGREWECKKPFPGISSREYLAVIVVITGNQSSCTSLQNPGLSPKKPKTH